MSPKDFVAYLAELHKNYRLLILEDPLDEDDWSGWIELTAQFGSEVMIVGDDLLRISNVSKRPLRKRHVPRYF